MASVFTCRVEWIEGKKASLSFDGKASLEFSYPPAFGGLEGLPCPEELFIAAVNACTLTSFLYFAERLGLKFKGYSCTAEGSLEKTAEGHHVFSKIVLKPTVKLESGEDEAKARKVFEYVEKFCIVSRSIEGKVAVELKPEITVKAG